MIDSKTVSHSLPSLAPPHLPASSKNSKDASGLPHFRKTSDDTNRSSSDLISFNDWPHVTSLLANQTVTSPACRPMLMKKASGPCAKFPRPKLSPLQNASPTQSSPHTPFTPMNPAPDGTPTPVPVEFRNSATSPFSQDKFGRPFASPPSTNQPNEPQKPRTLTTSVTCPLIPGVNNTKTVNNSFSAVFRTNNLTAGNTSQLQTSVARTQQLPSLCKFSPNNSLPSETLNFPPIIDAPWEEPDGSEDRSLPGSSVVSINLDTLPPPPPHLLNPFISPPASTSTPNQYLQQPTSTGPQTPGSPACRHAPGVSTFCNSPCCQNMSAGTSPTGNGPSQITRLPAIEEAQKIYDSLPDNSLLLPIENLQLFDRLGGGNFGQVVRGIYKTPHGQEVQVAVKTLKESQIALTGEQSILSEATTMTQLKHRHIVRLIGICKAQRIMLVLELAPLGPINKYLKKRPDTPACVLTELMHQVAQGMAYLEACKFVHRDLAARNVLLVTQRFAKISDFGMSKALNFGNDYYRAASAGKWPLKWYAPECIYYFRFDSKSDVWSFGIALWEVFSYGERPYKDMKGAQILSMLDQGLRLSRPPRCPESVYSVMQSCWNFDGVRRPTFAELVLIMSRLASGGPITASLNSASSSSGGDAGGGGEFALF